MKKRPPRAFTLIELLVLLAIVGLLAGILVPVMGHFRLSVTRTVDSNNIRMIGQASLNYANDHGGRLPGGPLNQNGEVLPIGGWADIPNLNALAAALARGADLNDATVWISRADTHGEIRQNLSVILDDTGQSLIIDPDFNQSSLSFCYVANLTTAMPSSQPVAFTRGLQTNGLWVNNPISIYRNEGGHLFYLGGNVTFHRDLGLAPNEGQLVASTGQRTNNLLQTQTAVSGVLVFARPGSPIGNPNGQAMTGSNP